MQSISNPGALVSITAIAAGLALAAPAAAQEVSCGGLGDGAPWIGGARATSDIASAAAPLTLGGVTVAPGTRGVALFTLGQAGVVRVEASPADPFGDTVLELFDATGRLIVMDDDSGGGLSSRAEPELMAGDYCLAVSGYSGAAVTADIGVSRPEHPALTAGLFGGFSGSEGFPPFVGVQPCLPDTPAMSLGAVETSGRVAGTETIAAAPYYRFTLASPQGVTIRAENPDADPYIYLFDGQGGLLAENDDYDSLNSRIDMTAPLPAGEYCIAMRSLADPNLPVTVSVEPYDPRAVAAEGYAMGDVAPPLDGSYPIMALGVVSGRLTHEARITGQQAQWFSIEIPSEGLVVVTADEVSDSDPVLSVFDEFGRMVDMNDDANGTLNSELTLRVGAGRYLVAVRQYSDSYAGTVRLGVQRYVPAQ